MDALEPLPGSANYFIGSEPAAWRTGIQTYGRIRCREVYPGIDLVYYGSQGQLEFDFMVGPGAAPESIRLHFEGAEGLEVDAAGGLIARLGESSVRWPRPSVYQFVQGVKREVSGDYVVRSPEEVAFQVSDYDRGSPLIIDPVLVYSSYLGGNDRDSAEAIAVDRSGNVYLTGETLSLAFPTASAYRSSTAGANDVFITKLNSNGTALIYSTYLGGSGNDFGQGIAVDSTGQAFVTGQTDSTNFPTRNAFQSSLAPSGSSDAFLVKLGPVGTNLLYATFFGGTNFESGNAIAVDSSGKVYLAGETSSGSGFPTQSPFQRRAGGGLDAFVAKFDPSAFGSASLLYSSWLGGAEDERATSLAVDASGNAYVTGQTFSPDYTTSTFPVSNALQPAYGGGGNDGFLAKISASGLAVVFSTFLGGSGEDSAFALALDASTNIYVTGETSSSDFPITADAAQMTIGDAGYFQTLDVFVTKIQPAGANIIYSTFLGGEIDESGTGIVVDGSGQVYVTGQTDSPDFPVTIGADQPVYGGGPEDAFVTKLNPAVPGPSGLIYSTYLGDTGLDMANGIALDVNGNYYVCGFTYSTNSFATAGALQAHFGGGFSDAFVAKFISPPDLSLSIVASPNPVAVNSNFTYTLRVNNNGRTLFTGVNLTTLLPNGLQLLSLTSNRGTCTNVSGTISCNFGTLTNNASAIVTLGVKAPAPGIFTNMSSLTANEAEINTANNRPVLITYVQGVADLTLGQTDTPDPVLINGSLVYTLSVTNNGPWPATQVRLTDFLSPTVNFVSAGQSQGSFSFGFGTVIFDLGNLAANASATVSLVVSPFTLDLVTNQASVSTFDLDSNQSNNSSAITTTVNPAADLALMASASPSPVIAGSNVTYTITVTNQGPSTATAVLLTNRLPAGTTFVSAQSTQGSCSRAGSVLTCNLGAVNSGAAAKVVIVVNAPIEGLLTNLSSVSSGVGDGISANNTLSLVTPVLLWLDAAVLVSDAPNPVSIHSNLVYSVIITNRGGSTATGVTLTDTLPGAANFVSAVASQGSFTRSGKVITYSLGAIASQADARLAITVTAASAGLLTNIATVTVTGSDSKPGNNSVTNVTPVSSLAPRPLLRIFRTNSVVIVSWPTNAVGFGLESRSTLASSNLWARVTNSPAVIGGQNLVTNNFSNWGAFFRLRGP